jgi:hypothetical protein
MNIAGSQSMRIGSPKEVMPGEARVAMTPDSATQLQKLGGLSMIFENTGQFDRAIQAEKLLLELMPNNLLIRERIDQLKQKAIESRI